jgi:chromosome condensin MukBEF complex kleisin-like MukF subunit
MRKIVIRKSHIISHYPPEPRRKLKAHIDRLIELRKGELAIFERNITKPLKDSIDAMEEAKKGRLSLEAMRYTNESVSNHIKKFLKARPKEAV